MRDEKKKVRKRASSADKIIVPNKEPVMTEEELLPKLIDKVLPFTTDNIKIPYVNPVEPQ